MRHIQRDNPAAASDVARTLYEACGSLRDFPYRGRTGRIDGSRELIVSGLPYIVVDRIRDQIVELLRIYHGAQDWP